MKKYAALGAATLGAVSATTFVNQAPAHANVYSPSGCRAYAYGIGWSTQCWVSSNGSAHVNYGGLVRGIGALLNRTDSDPLAFAYYMTEGVKELQGRYGLGQDGVVGPQTWSKVEAQVWNCSITDTDYAYYESNYEYNGSEACGYTDAYSLRVKLTDPNKFRWQTWNFQSRKYIWFAS